MHDRCRSLIKYGWTQRSSRRYQIRLQLKAQHKDTAQHQDTKTVRTAPELSLLRKTFDIRTIFNIRKTFDLRKALDIRKILLLLDDRSRTYEVSKVREDKAERPVLDVEEATVLPSMNAKGLRILFSKDLYISPVEED